MKRTQLLPFLLLAFAGLFTACGEEDNQPTYTCVDFSGKVYKTVVIGDQVWMAENLATKRERDGNEILNSKDIVYWPNKNFPQYSYFLDNTIYYKYGLIYNHLSAEREEILPEGWRIPTRADWEKLMNYVTAHPKYDSINWVGKALASSTEWRNSTIPGAVGFERATNNKFGFNAVPAGYRTEYGTFYSELEKCYFWTSTEDTRTKCLQLAVFAYNSRTIQFESLDSVNCGGYIRCVRDR